MFSKFLKSFSLIELLVAISLLGLILLTAGSFDFISRRFFQSSQRASEVLNEASFITEHMSKNIMQAKGYIGDKGYAVSSNSLSLRVNWALLNSSSSGGSNSDSWVKYQLDSNTNTLYFCSGLSSFAFACDSSVAGAEILSQKVTSLAFTDENGSIGIDITLRYDPSSDVDPKDNPEVSLSTSAALLQHSFN